MIDFSQKILDENGDPMPDELVKPTKAVRDAMAKNQGVEWEPPDLTLGRVAYHALTAQYAGEEGLGGDDKYARGQLAFMVLGATSPLALTSGQVTLLKECIQKRWGIPVMFQAWSMLDPGESVDRTRRKKP